MFIRSVTHRALRALTVDLSILQRGREEGGRERESEVERERERKGREGGRESERGRGRDAVNRLYIALNTLITGRTLRRYCGEEEEIYIFILY